MSTSANDPRASEYEDLHKRDMIRSRPDVYYSAKCVYNALFPHIQPKSAIDVGCGLATWLTAAKEFGIQDIWGLEGPWLDRSLLEIPSELVSVVDMERPFDLGRKFDMAICIEVAEHIDGAHARQFVQSLTAHAPMILFSAAIPHQGGQHHVNEQWQNYWSVLFADFGYTPIDAVRPAVWNDSAVVWFVRQNMLLYVSPEAIARYPGLESLKLQVPPLNLIHPETYLRLIAGWHNSNVEYRKLLEHLTTLGRFEVTRLADGRLNISKI